MLWPRRSRTLVNLSLLTGVVPDEWKKARVVPLFKSGGQEIMDNYRPISILPVVSKIAEKAVNVQLQLYLKQNNLLSPFQSDFRQHHSTLTAVTFFCDRRAPREHSRASIIYAIHQ